MIDRRSAPSVVFMGTPDFAVPALKALINGPYQVQAVYTQPPRPKGRGHHLHKSPVHLCAEMHHIPVLTPLSLKDQVRSLQELSPDIMIVAAYGLLLPPSILEIPAAGCVNIHASLLPRWRGAAPLQYALLEGDAETGVTLMLMDKGMDTGAMIASASLPITPHTTSLTLMHDLSVLGSTLMIDTLPPYLAGEISPIPQPTEGVRLAPKIKSSDAQLKWTTAAEKLERTVRAFEPSPGAWFMAKGKRFKVHQASVHPRLAPHTDSPYGTILSDTLLIACGDNSAFQPLILTPEGSKPMTVEACIRGYPFLAQGLQLD